MLLLPRPRFRCSASGLTLIELLMVIATVIILVAITFPLLGNMREEMSRTQCVTNLKGVGQAMLVYASDNNGRFPSGWIAGDNSPSNNWWYRLGPYLGIDAPETLSWSYINRINGAGGPMHCAASAASAISSYKMSYAHKTYLPEAERFLGLPVTRIASPATSLLVAEGDTHPEFHSTDPNDAAWGLRYPHKERLNALFADGHVDTFNQEELSERWDQFYVKATQP